MVDANTSLTTLLINDARRSALPFPASLPTMFLCPRSTPRFTHLHGQVRQQQRAYSSTLQLPPRVTSERVSSPQVYKISSGSKATSVLVTRARAILTSSARRRHQLHDERDSCEGEHLVAGKSRAELNDRRPDARTTKNPIAADLAERRAYLSE